MAWLSPFTFDAETHALLAACLKDFTVDAVAVIRDVEAAADTARVLREEAEPAEAEIRDRLRQLITRSEGFLDSLGRRRDEAAEDTERIHEAARERLHDALTYLGYAPTTFLEDLEKAHDALASALALIERERLRPGRRLAEPEHHFAGELRAILGRYGIRPTLYNDGPLAEFLRLAWGPIFDREPPDDVRRYLR